MPCSAILDPASSGKSCTGWTAALAKGPHHIKRKHSIGQRHGKPKHKRSEAPSSPVGGRIVLLHTQAEVCACFSLSLPAMQNSKGDTDAGGELPLRSEEEPGRYAMWTLDAQPEAVTNTTRQKCSQAWLA